MKKEGYILNLSRIHDYSFENYRKIKSVKRCGCFYCNRIFDTEKIHEWIDDENGQTAVCPFCGIDSVIPETVNNEYKLTKELLQELNRRFL